LIFFKFAHWHCGCCNVWDNVLGTATVQGCCQMSGALLKHYYNVIKGYGLTADILTVTLQLPRVVPIQ